MRDDTLFRPAAKEDILLFLLSEMLLGIFIQRKALNVMQDICRKYRLPFGRDVHYGQRGFRRRTAYARMTAVLAGLEVVEGMFCKDTVQNSQLE